MLALAGVVLASAQQTPAVAWEHTLIRHELADDFLAGSGHHAWMQADSPLVLKPKYLPLFLPGELFYESGRVDVADPEDGIARFDSPRIDIAGGFDEAWISWNVHCPANAGFSIELRVGRASDDFWSPWLHVAALGEVAVPFARIVDFGPYDKEPVFDGVEVRAFDGGRIEGDHFVSTQRWDRVQYSVRARCSESAGSAEVDVRRVVVCASRRGGGVSDELEPVRVDARRRIDVPHVSWMDAPPRFRESMTLISAAAPAARYRGERVHVSSFIEQAKIEKLDDFPVFTAARVVQTIYGLGVPGYITSCSRWRDAEQFIADGQPLVIRIAMEDAGPGEGQWLVLCGFDQRGDAFVNDPLEAAAAGAVKTLPRARLTRDWLARGGLACVFLPREK